MINIAIDIGAEPDNYTIVHAIHTKNPFIVHMVLQTNPPIYEDDLIIETYDATGDPRIKKLVTDYMRKKYKEKSLQEEQEKTHPMYGEEDVQFQ